LIGLNASSFPVGAREYFIAQKYNANFGVFNMGNNNPAVLSLWPSSSTGEFGKLVVQQLARSRFIALREGENALDVRRET
jgi:hypothetical protein